MWRDLDAQHRPSNTPPVLALSSGMLLVGFPAQGHVLSPSTHPITRSLSTLSILSNFGEHQVLLSSPISCCIQGNIPQLSGLQKVRSRSVILSASVRISVRRAKHKVGARTPQSHSNAASSLITGRLKKKKIHVSRAEESRTLRRMRKMKTL